MRIIEVIDGDDARKNMEGEMHICTRFYPRKMSEVKGTAPKGHVHDEGRLGSRNAPAIPHSALMRVQRYVVRPPSEEVMHRTFIGVRGPKGGIKMIARSSYLRATCVVHNKNDIEGGNPHGACATRVVSDN